MLRLAFIHACQHKAGRYAQATARLRDVKFTVVVQPDAEKRHAAARNLGVTLALESFEELLAAHAGEFDAVAIHGYVRQRAELACRAAKAGKHVFVSTPPAATTADADRIAQTCQDAGVTLLVGSHLRARPSIAAVKSALDSGKLGEPALLRSHCWEPREIDDAKNREKISQRDRGEFRSQVIQQLDLALWMFPAAPTEVYATGHASPADGDHWPDYLQIHLGFPNGGMALISISRSLPPGDDYQTVSLIGSTGAAYADDHLQKQLVFRGEHPQAVQRDEMIPALVAQLREFQQAIAEQRNPLQAVERVTAAMGLTDAVWKSLTDRQPVSLNGADS